MSSISKTIIVDLAHCCLQRGGVGAWGNSGDQISAEGPGEDHEKSRSSLHGLGWKIGWVVLVDSNYSSSRVVFIPLGLILILARSDISGGSIHTFLVVPYFDRIIFTALLLWETCQSPPAWINHRLSCLSCVAYWFFSRLRAIVVQCCVRLCALGESLEWRGNGRVSEFTDWNWQKSVFCDIDQGFGELWNKMLWAGVNSQLHVHIEPDVIGMGGPAIWLTTEFLAFTT